MARGDPKKVYAEDRKGNDKKERRKTGAKVFGFSIGRYEFTKFWFPNGAQNEERKEIIESKERWADKVDALIAGMRYARNLQGSHAEIEVFRNDPYKGKNHGSVTVDLQRKQTNPSNTWMKRVHGGW